jgi:predicted enzyme related to lactoylglutathione lyase
MGGAGGDVPNERGIGMLRDAKQIVPVLPVTDLERSKKFYRDTLGRQNRLVQRP